MHYFKPVGTPIKKDLILSLDQCPKTNKEKERMGNVPYARFNRKPNVYHVVYTATHLLSGWFGKSLLKQPRACTLASRQKDLSLHAWYE